LLAAAMVAMAALASAGVTKRAALAASVALLTHLDWIWIPAAIALESASMAALSSMQRRLLAAGGLNVGVRPMLATTFAGNALSVSVPLAGPELGTVFTFRRFTRQGADAPLAGWALLAGGVVSAGAGVLIVVGGGLSSGNFLATMAAVAAGLVAAAALAAVATAARRPRIRGSLERLAAWTLRQWSRMLRRPAVDPGRAVQAWTDRLGSLRLPASGWMTVTGLALANWLADAAVFAVSIQAAGAAVPWHMLLLVYGSGVAAQNLNITPGGFGITEGTLSLTLAAAGLRAGQALAAVLLYRLVSFWLVAGVGWLTFLWLRAGPATRARHKQGADAAGTGSTGELRPHELVLLHGQPGSMADWQQVTALLPAQLRVAAADRPGYGSSPQPAGGFAANARAVLDLLDSRGIQQAVLVGHSYGGGVALSAASMAPHRVEAVVLLASVGPGCVNRWDRLLAAPGAGPVCAFVAWRLTPWIARARLALITRPQDRPLAPGRHVNWQVWAQASRGHGSLWRTFLAEQRALVREIDELVTSVPSVKAPVLLLADPKDMLIPVGTARRLAEALPDARLQLVEGAGHHLPRRAPAAVADAITAFVAAVDSSSSLR
jgi:pimeloyl-ACP methyl ester carboxylesterase/uncharacterized membrane protein YbhN (UPF0104 family)